MSKSARSAQISPPDADEISCDVAWPEGRTVWEAVEEMASTASSMRRAYQRQRRWHLLETTYKGGVNHGTQITERPAPPPPIIRGGDA